MIKLFWSPQTRAARILWMLEELGEPYEICRIDVRDEASRADTEFRSASPMGKVPAITDGEVAMADSAAIAIYLADRYPDAGLAPAINHPQRGIYLYWMIYTPGVIEPAMMEKINGSEINEKSAGWGSFDLMLKTLDEGLSPGPWLLGDAFSAADLMVAGSVDFLRKFGMLPDGFPRLEDYADRCISRPAYVRAMALEEEKKG